MKTFVIIFAAFAGFVAFVNGAAVEPMVVKDGPVPIEVRNKDCHLPIVVGRCFASIPRYAYNHENDRCEEFLFGGCNANSNNFKSMEECEDKCNIQQKTLDMATDTAAVQDDVSQMAQTTAKVVTN